MSQMFNLFQTYVASVSFGCCIYMHVANVCFKCFIRMLQVFYLDVACFAMATNVFFWCFKRMLQVFQLFRTYVASVSFRCCKSKSWCCTCCSGTHLRRPPVALLGSSACVWVWRGRLVRARGTKRGPATMRAWDTERCRHPCEAGADIQTLAPSRRSGRSIIEKIKCKF
jgi:hypothetical protein